MPSEAEELARLRLVVEKLSAQVASLQQRVAVLEGRSLDREISAPPVSIAGPKREPEQLESRLGLTIVNRIGAITLAIGIIFFFKYAVDNAWIGAAGRVLLGLVGGLILIGVAEWLLRRDQQIFSQGLAGCGLAVLYTSLYASFSYYQLVPEFVAFVGMVAACALATAVSLRYQNPAIAVLALIGAVLTPPLLRNGKGQPWLLFPYLSVLDIASVAMAVRRRWPVLHAVAFAGTAILFLIWASWPPNRTLPTSLFWLSAFFLLFLLTTIWSFQKQRQTLTLVLLPFNTLWILIAAWVLLGEHHPGVFALFSFLLAIVHFIAAVKFKPARDLYATLYVGAQACLLVAALRVLASWADAHALATNRSSLLSETDSVFLAIYAVVMIAVGILRSTALERIIGLVLIAIVIAKLYLYDVWLLTRFYRISAFVALGVLLLAASYIYSRFKDKVDVLLTGKQEPDV
jgi:uncharacterized membrane protein